jgi:hypothetical protein
MTGLEVVAVLACVAGIISAFKDGHGIVQAIKEKRQRMQGRTPSKHLEASLAAGPVAVEAEKEEGVAKFGRAFAIGDGEPSPCIITRPSLISIKTSQQVSSRISLLSFKLIYYVTFDARKRTRISLTSRF